MLYCSDPGVVSSIPARSHTFFKIVKYFYYHSPPSAGSRRAGASYKGKYVHEVLVNRLFKLAQEKVWLG